MIEAVDSGLSPENIPPPGQNRIFQLKNRLSKSDRLLGLATRRGDTAAVAYFLSVGADPHLQNSEGTAIHKAVCSDNTEIACLLLVGDHSKCTT